jgi:hypothetical protein
MASALDRSFRHNRIHSAIEAMRAVTRRRTPADPARRRFLQGSAAGALFAGLPLLSACGGGNDGDGGGSETQTLTLFFNYSHLEHEGKSMSVHVGRHNYRLRPIAEVPHVLARERQHNRFLSALDDRHITHVVEGVPAPKRGWVSVRVSGTKALKFR